MNQLNKQQNESNKPRTTTQKKECTQLVLNQVCKAQRNRINEILKYTKLFNLNNKLGEKVTNIKITAECECMATQMK